MINLFLNKKSYFAIIISMFFIACGASNSGETTVSGVNSLGNNISNINLENALNEEAMLIAINKARSVRRDCYPNDESKGIMGPSKPLTWNAQLYAAALEHSRDLALSDTFSHYGSGTEFDLTGNGTPSSFDERILANEYGTNFYQLGENIAGGQRSIEEVMSAWLASPGHCANIMNDAFTEVGVALVIEEASTYGTYWSQEFGSKH